jgi:TP901 family phage tail tape measure protein
LGLAETAELAIRISLTGNARQGIRGLKGDLGGLAGSVGRVGTGFKQIGTGLARAGLLVGGAAVTGIAAAAKQAINFEDAFAGVRKTVNEADLQAVGLDFEKLAQSFRNMATEIPIAATDLARIGETAGALGIKAQDIETFTKTVALLGETTNLTSDAAAESLGKIGTILNLTGDDFTEFADILVNLGNQGASTESEIIEITKRFAAMGRQAGLSTDQILALSSSAASLGIEPEAAGSALSRIFANMATEIANGTAKGKEFAKITGDSLGSLRKQIDKGGALGILQETLEGIAGLSRTEAASVLKALGITNVRDRNAILLMAQNLEFVNEQLAIAKESEGALWKEAEKRFATTASKIQLVKNNLIETGIALGTEMLPAVNRALSRVIDVFKDPETKKSAIQLGKDVGKFIDEIDWNKVKDGALAFKDALKGAVDFTILLLKAFDKLPGDIKAASLSFLALNKLSGGLLASGVGNVVGGLAGAAATGLASRAPVVGRLFAQPVFVTNWPLGGLGGAGGALGGGISGAVGTVIKVIGVLGVAEIADQLRPLITQAGTDLHKTLGLPDIDFDPADLQWPFGPKGAPDWARFSGAGNGFNRGEFTRTAPSSSGLADTAKRTLSGSVFTAEKIKAEIDWSGYPGVRPSNDRALTGSVFKAEQTKASVQWGKIAQGTQTQQAKTEALRSAVMGAKAAQIAASERTTSAVRAIPDPSTKVTVNNAVRVSVTANSVTRSFSESSSYTSAHVGALNKSGALI